MKPLLSPEVIADAHRRIESFVHRTPVLESTLLNGWLGHRILFKAESFQHIGAFKIRGAANAMLTFREKGLLPDKVMAYSSGNHAQGVALAAKLLGVQATVFMTESTSAIKVQATRGYGAEVVLTATRAEAEAGAMERVAKGAALIPPFDSDDVLAGQGTACFEAIEDTGIPDAVFATCGGGGLLSGTWLATQLLAPGTPVFGAEPLLANDAAQSLRAGKVVKLPQTPKSVADGAVTLSVSERTFAYLKRLSGIMEIEEEAMLYWAQWLAHLLKTPVEPTSAAAMQAAADWLKGKPRGQKVLVILSGGNIGPGMYLEIWKNNHLDKVPAL